MRAIDKAMQSGRSEKRRVRALWVDRALEYQDQYPSDTEPLYLTLPGSDGLDIKLFVERDLIRVTETGAVETSAQHKVIAVESDNQSVLNLQKKFPGLLIIRSDITNVLRGTTPLRFPEGDHLRYCRARIINLDFQQSLHITNSDAGEISEPLFSLISKFAAIHSAPPMDWTLCLTLNASISPDRAVSTTMLSFLRENFSRSQSFATEAETLLGTGEFDRITDKDFADLPSLGLITLQKILMLYVPKRVAFEAHTEGWFVETRRNLRYGPTPSQAPMVTWIMDFARDSRAKSAPNELYLQALGTILKDAGHISTRGEVLGLN